jgi:translation initiation factor 3 subunit M
MKDDIPTTCVAAVFSDIEPDKQLKDIEKFMRDHGGQIDLDTINGELESKVEAIIRELRNILKETIVEGEMEMFLNSIMSLILLVPEDKINRPILNFSEAIVNANLPEKYGPMKLRVLTNLIYVAPERSNTDKYRILIDLIKCARNHRCINAVSVGINQVKKWVKEWKVSTEQIQELYRNMHEAYAATGDSANALQLLLELLGTYTKETAPKARIDASKCIINSINDPNVFIMDHLLLLEPVKVLEGENIHNLLNIFVSGRLQDYLEFYTNQKSFIESSGVKHDRNVTKMRVLTFLQSAENQKEVTFDIIQRDMQISLDEVESFIIEAVRTKMIRCKIDHLARKVIIDSTVQRTFTKQHWQSLKDKLEAWKNNLTTINNNLTTLLATNGTTN